MNKIYDNILDLEKSYKPKDNLSKDDEIFQTLIDYDIKASNIYNLIYYKNNKNLLKGPMDFYISPKYIK